jgi:EAL domain-containing protein (putative c-di-GMP-specific phosphodiesterase class I)
MDTVAAGSTFDSRLLVLDDDGQVGQTICAIARNSGFLTSYTETADAFFTNFTSWQPSHLIIDLQMPGVDGIETLKRLANLGCKASIIITSGLENRVLEAAGRVAAENGLRVLGVLAKPFTPSGLRTLLLDISGSPGVRPPGETHINMQLTSTELLELSAAIRAEQFHPWFQPKVDCATGALAGFECLARWQHPVRGLILPDHFIPQSEKSGLITELSKLIFSRTFDWYLANFRGSDLKIALNMSARLLADANFSVWLIEHCSARGIDPSMFILEITETSSLASPVMMLECLTQLRIKRFRLSIDDFGVGYSSLIQLARLPFSEMKIDKMFVMTAQKSQESQKIVAAIIGLARALGLSVTAEGVENAWTFDMLRDLGCDTAQGYFIARPLPAAAALAWSKSGWTAPPASQTSVG